MLADVLPEPLETTARFVERGALRVMHRTDHAAWIASTLALHAATRWTREGEGPVANPDVVDEMRKRTRALLERDVVDAESGLYPRRLLWSHNSAGYARRLPALLRDLFTLDRRRQERSWRLPTEIDDASLPQYFRRQFHWQRDGYLSDRSASLYDPGVEFLFLGMADVMRRRCLAPIVRETERQARPLRVLDVACGTGRTLWMLGQALPTSSLTGVDLSAPYLKAARKLTADLDDVSLLRANAEELPFPDDHFDVVTSTYLFHELPNAARRRVMAELARVLRPDGLLVLQDSAQLSDSAVLEPALRGFHTDFHEPFYAEYLGDALEDLVVEHGFRFPRVETHLVAKVVTARNAA